MPGNNLNYADDFAEDYDNSIINNNWNGPVVIFDLTEGLLNPASKILDLGIGTGESSKRFQQAKHLITGLDGSANMLKQCQKKNIGSTFIFQNMEEFPYKIENNSFEAIISNGVFHLIYDLRPVISEIKRILIPGGLFTFTFESADDKSEATKIRPGVWERETESGVLTYKYSEEIIFEYLLLNGFEILKKTRFLAYTNPHNQENVYFIAIVAQLLRI